MLELALTQLKGGTRTTMLGGDALRRLAAVALLIAPVATTMAPRLTTVFFPILSFVVIVAGMWHGQRWKELLTLPAALFVCLILSLYVFLNSAWAWNPGAGYAKASLLLGLILVVWAVSSATAALNERQSSSFAWAFIVSATLGMIYLLLEMVTDGAITRLLLNTLPAIRPDNVKRITIAKDIVTDINLSVLNQGITIVMLNLWPALLMLAALVGRQRRYGIMVGFFAATTFTVFASEHGSSQVALLASALAFGLAWKWNRLVLRGLAVAWCLAFVLVLPASFMIYDANLHKHPSMPHKIRLVIWDYTAEKTLENPWLGIGVNSTREMDVALAARNIKGKPFPRRTGHHAHNLFLQTWYELGAVGALLLAIAGALLVLRLETWPRNVQPYAAAAFTAFASIAAFAWGMWQSWWMCAIGLMAIYLCLGRQLSALHPQPSQYVQKHIGVAYATGANHLN